MIAHKIPIKCLLIAVNSFCTAILPEYAVIWHTFNFHGLEGPPQRKIEN